MRPMRELGAGRETYEEKFPEFTDTLWTVIQRNTSADPKRRSGISRFHGGLKGLTETVSKKLGDDVELDPSCVYRRTLAKRVKLVIVLYVFAVMV